MSNLGSRCSNLLLYYHEKSSCWKENKCRLEIKCPFSLFTNAIGMVACSFPIRSEGIRLIRRRGLFKNKTTCELQRSSRLSSVGKDWCCWELEWPMMPIQHQTDLIPKDLFDWRHVKGCFPLAVWRWKSARWHGKDSGVVWQAETAVLLQLLRLAG